MLNKPVALVLALVKFLIPFLLIAPAFELQRDEFLYFQQGQHFDIGYLENPPVISWMGMISGWLGGHEWTIRLWPALIGSLTVLLTCLITARLGGGGFAQFLAGFGVITAAFLRIHILYQPNILDIFFWTLSLYFLIRFIQTNEQKYFLLIILSLAVGWWSKSSILFIALSIFMGLLVSRYRKVFTQRRTYVVGVIGLAIVLPNILWQYFHNWPLWHHMQELRESQLVHVNPFDFIKDQFLLLLPVIFVWISGLIWCFQQPKYRIVGWIYLFVIALLIFGSGKSYYSLGIYPALLAAGGYAIEKWTSAKIWIRYAVSIFAIGITVVLLPLGVPMLKPQSLADLYAKMEVQNTGQLKWEDQRDHPLPQDFADMLGWKELSTKAEKAYQSQPQSLKNETIVYCRHYGQAGALKFYSRDKEFTDKVISDNGSFLLWIDTEKSFRHLLFIGRRFPGKDDIVFQHFRKSTILDSVTSDLSRQRGDKIILFENGTDSMYYYAKKGLEEMQSRFNKN